MGKKYDLLRAGRITRHDRMDQPKLSRDTIIERARKFDYHYFDGSRAEGYGGYNYDGRWIPVAKRLIKKYGLTKASKVLDVGCAKGFLMKDLTDILPGIDVWGLDISDYAKNNSPEEIRDRIKIGCCSEIPFENDSFDLVVSINTVHNLEEGACCGALREIERVSRNSSFVQVDAYRTERERAILERWVLTARTIDTPFGWLNHFRKAGYTGDYFWTIIEEIR